MRVDSAGKHISGNDHLVGVVERADLRRHPQPNGSVGIDIGRELQLHSVGLELHGNRRHAPRSARLHDGIRKLSARQEARRAAMNRGQVRLGQYLQNALGLQVADGGSQAVSEIEVEQIQEVADDGGIRAVLVSDRRAG